MPTPLPSYYFPSHKYTSYWLSQLYIKPDREVMQSLKGSSQGSESGKEGGEWRRQRWTSQGNAISIAHSEVHVHLCWSSFWLLAEMTLLLCNNRCLHGSSYLSFRKPETFPGERIRASRLTLPSQTKNQSLLHIEWIDNKVLPQSTGNYIQQPGITYNRKECGKKKYVLCITESLCCTVEINTTL